MAETVAEECGCYRRHYRWEAGRGEEGAKLFSCFMVTPFFLAPLAESKLGWVDGHIILWSGSVYMIFSKKLLLVYASLDLFTPNRNPHRTQTIIKKYPNRI